MRCPAALALLALIPNVVAGCTTHAPLPSGAIRVPTDDSVVAYGSLGILCGGSATLPLRPDARFLEGDPSDPAWPVWLQADDGSRFYVVWPRDFYVRFDPDATLLDEAGKPILHAGSPITIVLPTTDPPPGTKDRPYVAESFSTGLIQLPHCYTRDP